MRMHIPFGLLTMTLALGACAAPTSDDSVGETSSDITNGTASATPDDVVMLTKADGSGTCTGNVISQHYILTAAHCFPRSPFDQGAVPSMKLRVGRGGQGEVEAYNDVVDYIPHPTFEPLMDKREDWDIAVIHLRGAGMGPNPTVIHMFDGPSPPAAYVQNFEISGYGFGSTNFQNLCPIDDATAGTKRTASFQFFWDPFSVDLDNFAVQGNSRVSTTCQGDSGAGYRLHYNNTDYLFAVLSWSDDKVVGDGGDPGRNHGTMVQPKVSWIVSATVAIGAPISVSVVRDHRGALDLWSYNVTEKPIYTAPPSPPHFPGPF